MPVLSAIVFFSALLAFFPAPLLLIFPGANLLLASRPDGRPSARDESDFLKAAARRAAASLAFWVVSFWATMAVPATLTGLFYFLNSVFILDFSLRWGRRPGPVSIREKGLPALLAVMGLVIAARFAPFFCRITGSVGDMTQHNAMTRVIVSHNGFSPTYDPVMPFPHFGEYPLGFHTLSAFLDLLGCMPYWRATNFVSCAAFVLMNLALYGLLRRRFSKTLSLAAASLSLFLSHYPQFLNQWGSGPTALSAMFLFFAYDFLDDERPPERLAAGLVLAAGVLSHLIPPVGFAAYYSARLLVRTGGSPAGLSDFFKRNWKALALAALLIAPFLWNFNFDVYRVSRAALVHGHQDSLARIYDFRGISRIPFLGSALGGSIVFLFVFGPWFGLSMVLSGFRAAWRGDRKDLALEFAGGLLVFAAALAVFRTEAVGFYHLFQMERIHYFLLIPGAMCLAAAAQEAGRTPKRTALAAAVALSAAAAAGWGFLEARTRGFSSHYTEFKNGGGAARFLLRDLALGNFYAYSLDDVNASVTPEDMDAFAWIRRHTSTGAVFLTNAGDSGPLIASIGERRIWNLHGMDIWHGEDLAAWRRENPATHVYAGKRSPPVYGAPYRRDRLTRPGSGYREVYERGGCSVFEAVSKK